MNLSQILESVKNSPSRLLVKRNLIIIAALVIVAELIWAYRSLIPQTTPKPVSGVSQSVTSDAKAAISSGVISLKAPATELRVGEKVVVRVEASSIRTTDGTDLVILYDPQLLSVVPAGENQAMKVGTMYNDYPVNSDDNQGKIAVSGISTLSQGVIPKGVLGTITFQAKAAGTAKISLDFTPGSTTDTNMIEARTAKDVLSKVENLEIRIIP